MVILIIIGLVIAAGVAGFAFRGKESKALKSVGNVVKTDATKIVSKL